MNPATELAPQLKQLRLSGILDSLDARNQAIDAKLAYTEFLALLIQTRSPGASRRSSAPGCAARPSARPRRSKALSSTACPRPTAPWSMTSPPAATSTSVPGADRRPCGHRQEPSGAGARALRRASGARRPLRLLRAVARQPERRPRTGATERKLQQLARVPVLIIDDFGLKPFAPPPTKICTTSSPLRAGCHHRHQQPRLHRVGSGLPGNRLLASATVDRLRHNAYCPRSTGHFTVRPRQGPGIGEKRPCRHPENIDLTPNDVRRGARFAGFYMPIIGGSIVAVSDN